MFSLCQRKITSAIIFTVTIINCLSLSSSSSSVEGHRNWHLVNNNGYCGISGDKRIIGGVDAGLGKYPWIVRLGFAEQDYVFFKCAGSIINTKYVVTANHCFTPNDELVVVRAGEYDEDTNPDCEGPDFCAPPFIDYGIEEITNHPDYREGESFVNDITLIRINGEFEFNDFIMPICLEYDTLLENDHVGEFVEVAGWGIYDLVHEETSTVLQRVTLEVRESEVCVNRMKTLTTVDPEKQICAGGEIGRDSCSGDSGGPLMSVYVVNNVSPRYFLIGVVSFGLSQCGVTTMPAIYSRVSAFLPWILDNIQE